MTSHYVNDSRWSLAIHEAAHAVVGSVLGLEIEAITIDFDSWNGGASFKRSFDAEEWRRDLLVCLAGEEAQKRVDPTGTSLLDENGRSRAAGDQARALQAVSQFNSHEDCEEEDRIAQKRMDDGQAATIALLDMVWVTIEALANAVIDNAGNLSQGQVEQIVSNALPPAARSIAFVLTDYRAP